MIKYLLIGIILLSIDQCSFSQNFNRPVPADLYPYAYTQYSAGYNFYLGINPFLISANGQAITNNVGRGVILDQNGYIVWYQDTFALDIARLGCFSYNSEHGFFQEVVTYSPDSMEFITLNNQFQVSSIVVPVGVKPDGHEYEITTDGHHVITTASYDTMDLSGYTFSGTQGSSATNVKCGGFQEFDNAGNLLFSWNSCDDVFPTEMYGFNYNPQNFDYFHINSVDETEDGHFIVSARHTNCVYKIDRGTGAILWRLGGVNSDFTFSGGTGFNFQHDARDLGNGRISIHDNGNLSTPKRSRELIYQLDTVNWIATLENALEDSTLNYGRAMGSYRIYDGNSIVNYGFINRPSPSIIGFDQNDIKNFEISFQDSVMNYRAIPFELDFTLPRPEISCLDSNGLVYLKAPNGFTNYEWSNGDLSQTTLPVVGETYQVYVPYGVGFLASLPFSYNGICDLQIEENQVTTEKTLLRTIDLLGRDVKHQESGVVYISVYSDGSTQKTLKGL